LGHKKPAGLQPKPKKLSPFWGSLVTPKGMNSKGKPFGICPICCGIFVVWGWQILGRCDDWRLIGCFRKHPTESQKNGEKLQQGQKWLGKCSPNKKCVHEMQDFPHKHSGPWRVV